MLLCQMKKSARTILNTWNRNKLPNINFYHFGEKSVFGYLKDEKNLDQNLDQNLINIETFNEKQLIDEFRTVGHFLANINPLEPIKKIDEQLQRWPEKTSLLKAYLDNKTMLNKDEQSVNSLIDHLIDTYCGDVGIEFMHITNVQEREWIAKFWEDLSGQFKIDNKLKERIAELMIKCETFDEFLALKFPSVKRYGAEGCESMLVFFDELFRQAAKTNPSILNKDYSKINENEKVLSDLNEDELSLRKQITDIVICKPHRGRLNFLTILNQYPEVKLFSKLKGKPEFDLSKVDGLTGDVVSHLFNSINLQYNEQGDIINDQTNIKDSSLSKLDILEYRNIKPVGNIHISLLPNPSHLETIGPACSGKVRAKLLSKKLAPYYDHNEKELNYPILSVQVHGDSAFSGQGIITEQLNFSQFPNFSNFGTIHLIVNNQVGYTIEGKVRDGQLVYTSNAMKTIDCPVLHVNASNPEQLVKSVRFALKYREMFNKDILIDLVCFRKHGHNELDDPTFTNAVLYKKIKNRKYSIPMDYALNDCKMSEEQIKKIKSKYIVHLNEQLDQVDNYKVENNLLLNQWSICKFPKKGLIEEWTTGINDQVLRYLGFLSMNIPKDFKLHKNLNRIFQNKIERIKTGSKIDWSLAETFAFATLMYQNYNVRISGQDVGRGTFSQRHMMLVDQETDEPYIPLNAISADSDNKEFIKQILSKNPNYELNLTDSKKNLNCGSLEIANSILSEEAVLSFEWGFSLESPKTLPIFEAQFGDFFNGAQIIFDTLISAGEAKWGLQTGLVVLLPHGMDGAGPEHSSARIERFLQMSNSSETEFDSDLVNLEIAFPTTPANYFHLLRRQCIRPFRKPLIIFSPKGLLRHPQCVSELNDFVEGTRFQKVLIDLPNSKSVKKLILCTGKHYYTLKEHMKENNIDNVTIVRIEQLSPFPALELKQILEQHLNVKEIIWSQECHRNMGAWNFVNTRIKNLFNINLKYAGRSESPVPAVGISEIHKQECVKILEDTFK